MLTAGSEQKFTIADLDALLEHEQRAYERIDHRTRIQVICPSEDGASVRPDIRTGWTEDLSATGAKLFIVGPLATDRIWIRIPESARRNGFIECRVMWRDTTGPGGLEANCRCGVQFGQILSREEFDQVLASGSVRLVAADQPSSCEDAAL